MTYRGRVRNGVVVLEEQVELPEDAPARVEILESAEEEASFSLASAMRGMEHEDGPAYEFSDLKEVFS